MGRRLFYDPDHDYYQIIGVESHADAAAIQQAYRHKAKELHPDLNQHRIEWAKEQFQLLNEAYSVLSDPRSKRLYDDLRWPFQTFGGTSRSTTASPKPPPAASPPPSWTARPRRYRPRPVATEPGEWLKDSGLGALQPLYRTLVNLLDSPYRYVLFLLALVLVINIVVILAVVFLGDGISVETSPTLSATDATVQNVSGFLPTMTLVPTLATVNCGPHLQIYSPATGTEVDAQMLVWGRLDNPDMFTYRVLAVNSELATPVLLREARSVREAPIESGVLASLAMLQTYADGTYEIQVEVLDKGGAVLNRCVATIVLRK